MLPIYKACVDIGCWNSVRFARQNANTKQARLDVQHAREALRQEKANGDESNGLGVDVVAHVAKELVENEVEEVQGELPSSIVTASSPRHNARQH